MPNTAHKTPRFFVSNALKDASGVTLVELLVVFSVMAALSAVLMTTINTATHRKNTQDGLIRSNMLRLVEGLEAYHTVEGVYPANTADATLSNYINNGWIDNQPVGITYNYNVNANRTQAGIMVTLNSGKKLKYRTNWAKIQECAASAVINDDSCP
jgi:Tfp pilus assembly protein PilE